MTRPEVTGAATVVDVTASPGRARCRVETGALSPRVLASTPDGARVALVATGALLLGGDVVRLDVTVGPGAWLEVVETAGTVCYPGPPAGWHVNAQVGVDGVLVWAGLPFVVAQGADVVRTLRLDLADGARAVLRETTVLGRAGEDGGTARLRTDVALAGRPLLVEELDLAPGAREAPGVLGSFRVIDVVTALGFRPPPTDPAPAPGRRAGSARPGAGAHRLDLAGPGAVVRHLARDAHTGDLEALARDWGHALLGRGHGGPNVSRPAT